VAYVDRRTVKPHLERALSDTEWSATASNFTAMSFDEHIGDAGTIGTDWIEAVCLRAGVPGRGPGVCHPVELFPAPDPAMRVTRTCSSCGYTADYASTRPADAHPPRHCCAKHRLSTERAARHADRARKRVTRECIHTVGQHVHGTRAAYVKDCCRCTDRTAANTAVSRTANRQRTYGRWQPFIDAGPVRDHLVVLRAAGIGVERIAT
jgi:hypothetical protein